jgi:hypothetical protein
VPSFYFSLPKLVAIAWKQVSCTDKHDDNQAKYCSGHEHRFRHCPKNCVAHRPDGTHDPFPPTFALVVKVTLVTQCMEQAARSATRSHLAAEERTRAIGSV